MTKRVLAASEVFAWGALAGAGVMILVFVLLVFLGQVP